MSDNIHSPLILDVAGTALTDTDRRRLAHPLTGGVILFARNWQNRQQLLELTAAIKAVRGDLLICVDHEGGRVQRFRSDGFTHLPPMQALGKLWQRDSTKKSKGKKKKATKPAKKPKTQQLFNRQRFASQQCRHRHRLCAGERTACLWCRFQLYPGAGFGLGQQRRDWRPRL